MLEKFNFNKLNSIFNIYFIIIIFISISLLILRLENPLSSMGFLYSQSSFFDEMVYSTLAIKEVNYPVFIQSDSALTLPLYSPIQNILSYITFNVFGPNYFSLRIPALIAYLLCILIAYRIGFELKWKKITILGFTALLAVDPGIWYFGGTNHPVIFRCVGVLTFIFFIMRFPNKSFYVGLIVSLCVFLIYPPNAFLMLGGGFFFLFREQEKFWERFKNCLIYSIGILLGLLISELIVFLFFKRFAIIEGFWWALTHYSNRIGIDDGKFKDVIRGLSLLINPPLTILVIASIFSLFWKKIKHISLDYVNEILFFIILAFLIQVIFLNDYPVRNMVIATPIFLILVLNFISNLKYDKSQIYYLCSFFFIGALIGFYEFSKHSRWISDYIHPDIIYFMMITICAYFAFKLIATKFSQLQNLEYFSTQLVITSIIFVGILVNINIYFKLKHDLHSHPTIPILAKMTQKGCVVGYGNTLYLAGGGIPLFFPHIHSPGWISSEMNRLQKNGICKTYYLFMDFKKKKLPNTTSFYGRNWSLISTVKTNDIYNSYILSLWKNLDPED